MVSNNNAATGQPDDVMDATARPARALCARESTQAPDLADLVLAARGDRAALGRLYDRHAPILLALGLRLVGEQREAEDLVHDCFVEAWKHAGDYDPRRATVKTWLVLRMRSRCLDRLRSAGHARRESLSDHEEEVLARVSGRPEGLEPEARVDATRLVSALSALPEEQRLVIAHVYYEGLSSTEIAAVLGIPLGTVKSRVRVAMEKLRAAFGVGLP